jgi:hypothetical protein
MPESFSFFFFFEPRADTKKTPVTGMLMRGELLVKTAEGRMKTRKKPGSQRRLSQASRRILCFRILCEMGLSPFTWLGSTWQVLEHDQLEQE